LYGVDCPTQMRCVGVGGFNASGRFTDPLKTLVLKET
jgi:hypothetical protein